MRYVILDTDFLIKAAEWRVDLQSAIQEAIDDRITLCILDRTLTELEGKPQARLVRQLISKLKMTVFPTTNDKPVDTLLLEMTPETQEKRFVAATQDRNLKEKLKKRKWTVLTIRQQHHIIRV